LCCAQPLWLVIQQTKPRRLSSSPQFVLAARLRSFWLSCNLSACCCGAATLRLPIFNRSRGNTGGRRWTSWSVSWRWRPPRSSGRRRPQRITLFRGPPIAGATGELQQCRDAVEARFRQAREHARILHGRSDANLVVAIISNLNSTAPGAAEGPRPRCAHRQSRHGLFEPSGRADGGLAEGRLRGATPQTASASFARTAFLRSFGSRMSLRSRTDFGVTSTSSSSWI